MYPVIEELNIGTNGGQSCAEALSEAVAEICAQSSFSSVVNGRFRGGWTTRHYGRPAEGVHALQLEMSQDVYLDETTKALPPARRPGTTKHATPPSGGTCPPACWWCPPQSGSAQSSRPCGARRLPGGRPTTRRELRLLVRPRAERPLTRLRPEVSRSRQLCLRESPALWVGRASGRIAGSRAKTCALAVQTRCPPHAAARAHPVR